MSQTPKPRESKAPDESQKLEEAILSKKNIKYWISLLPGRRIDYFFLGLAVLDIFLLLFINNNENLLKIFHIEDYLFVFTIFDYLVIAAWCLYLYSRYRREDTTKINFITQHWYEFVGLVPLAFPFRPFLLLRAAKFAIAFYKLGRSENDVSTMITRDITFRFRDIIVDTIADAVFMQSLQRVQEVMLRLDYSQLAHKAFQDHQEELREVVNEAIHSKSIVGELSKIPFLNTITDQLGEDISQIFMEVLETNTTGDIMKEITRGILQEMSQELKTLDLERITAQEEKIDQARRTSEKIPEDP